MARWDADASSRFGKAALGWIRHDVGTLLRSQGQAQGTSGSAQPDAQFSWFHRHPADDPFVARLGITNRVARAMRLSGVVLSVTEWVEAHFWDSDGMPWIYAQCAYDFQLVGGKLGMPPHEWRLMRRNVRLF